MRRTSSLFILILLVCAAAFTGRRDVSAAAGDVILRAATAPVVVGAWSVVADSTAAGGSRMANPNAGAAKVAAPLASPPSYFELTFQANAGTAFHLWLRGKAQGNSYDNDSVYVQFSDSVTSSGAATWRIGTTSGTSVVLEDCSGCGVSNWGWQDNGYGTLGTPVYFAQTGTHTIRIQVREDGLSIDQIVLSPSTYFTNAPGATKNDTTILTGGGPPPPAITPVRGPYLQQLSSDSAVIVWATREPGPANARVGSQNAPAATTFYSSSTTGLSYNYYQHEATITGLTASTTYAYDLFVGGVAATSGTDRLTTAPANGTGTVRFIIFGDSGTGSPEQLSLASVMAADTFDLALHGGDIAYGNSGGTGDAGYATYQNWFFDVYATWLRRRPFMPTMGNHDSRASNNWGQAYLNLFVLPDGGGAGAFPDNAERYYSFDYGPIHFVSLDSELAFLDTNRRAAQVAWLDADLAGTSQPWKIVYFHRPPYSSGTNHGSDLTIRQTFGPLFEKYGVQYVLNGHEHSYERSVPWRVGTLGVKQAVTYIVSGGAGGPVYPINQSEWTAKASSTRNYVRLTVGGCTATVEAIGMNGAAFDSNTLNRCNQASDAGPPTVSFVSPAAGSTVSGVVTVNANAGDDIRVEKVDLWVDGQLKAIDTTAPYQLTWDASSAAQGSHTLELRAYDIDGNRTVRSQNVNVGTSSGGGADVVIHATSVPVASIVGAWSKVADSTAADGLALKNPNQGQKLTASASPASYFEVTFNATAGVAYHLWLRMKAEGNSYDNDSVYVQFDNSVTSSGTATYRIGTTSAVSVILEEGTNAGVHNWGWNDNGYGTLGGNIYFATTGTQRLRIQVREDGSSIDQIVLSPGTYLSSAPGSLKDDNTVVVP